MTKMAIAVLISVAFVSGDQPVRFTAEGLRIGDTLVQGAILELKSEGGTAMLASGASVEPLVSPLEIEVAIGRSLIVDPGLRAGRVDGAVQLSSHGGRKILIMAGERELMVVSPAKVVPIAEGWRIGEEQVGGGTLHARLQSQDDVDKALKKLQALKEQMEKALNQPMQKGLAELGRVILKTATRVLSRNSNPALAEMASAQIRSFLQGLAQLSPAGF
jgi:hypothetical protein